MINCKANDVSFIIFIHIVLKNTVLRKDGVHCVSTCDPGTFIDKDGE